MVRAARSAPPAKDELFDRLLPPWLQALSDSHWTPLAVVQHVMAWFDELDVRSVLDIGSGAGKFCVAGALASRRPRAFTGLEHRPALVDAARDLAMEFGLEHRVRFIAGALGEHLLPGAEAYYLFNPFAENLCGTADHIDESVRLDRDRSVHDIACTIELLEVAPSGTVVVTYHGFGGRMPRVYQELRTDHRSGGWLRLWRKRSAGGPAGSADRCEDSADTADGTGASSQRAERHRSCRSGQ